MGVLGPKPFVLWFRFAWPRVQPLMHEVKLAIAKVWRHVFSSKPVAEGRANYGDGCANLISEAGARATDAPHMETQDGASLALPVATACCNDLFRLLLLLLLLQLLLLVLLLCCAVLCCAVLCHAVLKCASLCCSIALVKSEVHS